MYLMMAHTFSAGKLTVTNRIGSTSLMEEKAGHPTSSLKDMNAISLTKLFAVAVPGSLAMGR
jgi:hypothetical protein